MVMGHYSTALVPYAFEENRRIAPFFVFLFAAQFLDFIMFSLVVMGYEVLTPAQFLEADFLNIRSQMPYSHDLVPVAMISAGLAILLGGIFRSVRLGVWVFALGLFHEVLDLLVGFEHNWFGPGTEVYGLNVYNTVPVIGLLAEAIMCAAIVTWYIRKRAAVGSPVSSRTKYMLYGILVGGTIALLPIATAPLSRFFG